MQPKNEYNQRKIVSVFILKNRPNCFKAQPIDMYTSSYAHTVLHVTITL